MDAYSVPAHQHSTRLARVLVMPERTRPEKPGRSLMVTWDARHPLLPGFTNRYSYVVRFGAPGSQAGNHYHHLKHELYCALHGRFQVMLEDTTTHEREAFTLAAGDNAFLYVQPRIAHVVTAKTPDGILLVVANSPELSSDEFPYHFD